VRGVERRGQIAGESIGFAFAAIRGAPLADLEIAELRRRPVAGGRCSRSSRGCSARVVALRIDDRCRTQRDDRVGIDRRELRLRPHRDADLAIGSARGIDRELAQLKIAADQIRRGESAPCRSAAPAAVARRSPHAAWSR
jgi:hypothetical protein